MLAYVFWHWPRPDASPDGYEALQRAFHQSLADAPPAGFVRSRSHAVYGLPWANRGAAAYEDWYLVRDSAALDPLNEAAVSAGRRRVHDAAAAPADGGTAGLLRLRLGTIPAAARHTLWFSKPRGISYAELWRQLTPCVERAGGALWARQMTLGPQPEFCVRTERPVQLALETTCLPVEARDVWPLAALPEAR